MKKFVILSGAGLSADSGIKTFRDKDGLWENHPVDEVATLDGFSANPSLVHRFYNERRLQLQAVEPNEAHVALARLESADGIEVFHVTQNVDNLCERAGCRKLIHMHGELTKCRCLSCAKVFEWLEDTTIHTSCPECGFISEWGGLRPHIVWFGEVPFYMDTIEDALNECDMFVAIGTSGRVYPAAGFVSLAKRRGAETVLINMDQPDNLTLFDRVISGPARTTVPQWVEEVVAGSG